MDGFKENKAIAEKQDTITIAVLSSFTIDPLIPCLSVECHLVKLEPKFYVAPFNRFQDVILDQSSGLYSSNPEIIFFFVELESLLDEMFRVNFPECR